MRIKITMVSGKEVSFKDGTVGSLIDFIKKEFKSQKKNKWYSPFKEGSLFLSFDKIESIEEDSD